MDDAEPHLPTEVWQRVGTHLDPTSRARMARLSRTTRDTFSAASDPRAWVQSVIRSGQAKDFVHRILLTGQYAEYLPELYASLSRTDRDALRPIAQYELFQSMWGDTQRAERAIQAGAFPMASSSVQQQLAYASSHHLPAIYNLLLRASERSYPREEAEAELDTASFLGDVATVRALLRQGVEPNRDTINYASTDEIEEMLHSAGADRGLPVD